MGKKGTNSPSMDLTLSSSRTGKKGANSTTVSRRPIRSRSKMGKNSTQSATAGHSLTNNSSNIGKQGNDRMGKKGSDSIIVRPTSSHYNSEVRKKSEGKKGSEYLK
eukprot:9846254-Ditylum_brightwellii.AAC.1